MKKIIAMILALVMVLSMVPFAAFAAEELTLQMGQNTATLTGSEDGVTYTWTAEDSGTLTITMPENAENGWEYSVSNSNATGSVKTYYSDGYDAETDTMGDVVYSQTMDVTKDDVITVWVNTLGDPETYEYSAGTVVFTAAFESAVGSESQPIELLDNDTTDGAVITADTTVPAYKTLYYSIYRIQDMILTVTGEGSFTVTCGEVSVAAANGVAIIEGVSVESMYSPLLLNIENTGSAELNAQIKFTFPLGAYNNPEVIEELGSLSTVLEAGDDDGYNYIWTAVETGTVSFDIYVPMAELVADIVLTNQNTGSSTKMSTDGVETVFGEELTYTTVSLDVEAGEQVLVAVSAIPVDGNYGAMTVESTGYFTAPAGTEDNPLLLNIAEAKTFEVKVAPGATVYCRNTGNVDDMILTISGGAASVEHNEEIYTTVDGAVSFACIQESTNTPAWFVITNTGSAEITYNIAFSAPLGSWENPQALELDTAVTATVKAASVGYYYTWTAEEEGTFTVAVDPSAANGWFYTITNNVSGASTDEHVNAPVDEEGNPSDPVLSDSVGVHAGDEVIVIVNTYDAANPNNAPAGSVTITASFVAGEIDGEGGEGGEEGGDTDEPVGGVIASGEAVTASVAEPVTFDYTPTTNGTMTLVISGTKGFKAEVKDAEGGTIGLPRSFSSGAEQTLTFELTAGITYTTRIVGYVNYDEGTSVVTYSASWTPAEGSGETEKLEYEVDYDHALALGDNALTLLDTAITTIYEFEPAEVGVYTFTAPADAILGYWGGGAHFLNDPGSTTNTYEWTCTGVGQSAFIGISGVEGEFTVNVAKTGEYNPVVYTEVEYENKAALSQFSLGDGTLGSYVDVSGVHTPVLGNDGYYHLDSADGDILLIDLNYQDIILSAKLNSDIPTMYLYTQEKLEDGTYIKYSIANAIKAYEAVMDENGYYPLTEDLIIFYRDYATDQGVWSFNQVTGETPWMYCCRTVSGLEGGQGGEGGDEPDQPVQDGTREHPVVLEDMIGGNCVLAEGDDGYYYSYTAATEGKIACYFYYPDDVNTENWDIVLTNTSTDETKSLLLDGVDNNGMEVQMDVQAGNEIIIKVLGATNIEMNWGGMFTAPEGSELNPIYIEWEWDDAYVNATASVTVGAGKTLYYYGQDGMILTIDGVETAQNEGAFSITNAGSSDATYALALATPVGASTNPEVIEEIANFVSTRDLEEGADYYYIWTATENGKVVLDVTDGANITVDRLTYTEDSEWPISEQFTLAEPEMDENWNYTGWVVAENLEVVVTAGQTLKIQINALTDWSTWTAPAMMYTLTTDFTAGDFEEEEDVEVAAVENESVTTDGYVVEYTAETAGTLTVTAGNCTPDWYYQVIFPNGEESLRMDKWYDATAHNHVSDIAGDWKVMFYAYNSDAGEETAGTVSFNVTFTPAEGGGEVEQADYEIDYENPLVVGDNTRTLLDTAVTTIYVFEPTEAGTYRISAPAWATLGIWGYGEWFLSDPGAMASYCEWECTDVGQAVYIGVSGIEDAFVISVVKTADGEEPEETEYLVYENVHTPSADFGALTGDETMLEVNLTEAHSAVAGADGYYHLDTADGPVLYVDLITDEFDLSQICEGALTLRGSYEENGATYNYDFLEAMGAYNTAMGADGLYPLTVDLMRFIKGHGGIQGWFNTELGMSPFAAINEGENIQADTAWMVLCRYEEPVVIEKFDFAGSTMTLGNELVLNFVYNKALLTGTDNYAKVTIAREDGDYTYEIPQSEWTAFNAALNQIPVKVFAKEMTDEVTVVICNAAGQEVSNPRTGSVVAYCDNLFAKSTVQKDKAMA
ncbi:MAG: hypothetical protein IJO45_02755, partial [Oscillospiraceae bacterium]|nr:hypothetical protein [Oscillospiraceae bacterium]